MARNVFISFRFSDGHDYKEELAKLFDQCDDTVDCSEDEDRSMMSESTIQKYLYGKLKRSSITIILLTPKAISYNTKVAFNSYIGCYETVYDDWIYDEVRYSLEDRDGNAPNGLIGVYVSEAKPLLISEMTHQCEKCGKPSTVNSINMVNNLARKNMMNVKPQYKNCQCDGIYDCDWDSYCSLISYDEFTQNISRYIDIAYQKRQNIYKYDLCKRIKP